MTGKIAWLRSLGSTIRYVGRHPVGRRHPLTTLARVAFWQARLGFGGGLTGARWVNDSQLLARRGLNGVTGNLYYGLHEFVEMAFVAMLLRAGDLFADVGANAGTYTVLASKVAGARTVAFEPGDGAADVFARTIERNGIGHLVDLRREAVGDREGEVRFTRGLDTMNRVSEDGELAVRLTSLDAALAGAVPLAIKFDIEGGEDAGVRGARSTLSDPALEALLIETVSDETAAAIAAAGLHEVQFDPWTRQLYDGAPRLPINNRIYVRNRAVVQDRLRSAPSLRVAGMTL